MEKSATLAANGRTWQCVEPTAPWHLPGKEQAKPDRWASGRGSDTSETHPKQPSSASEI